VNQTIGQSQIPHHRLNGHAPLRRPERQSRWRCLLRAVAASILLVLFPCTGTTEGFDELWLAVFPGVETQAPKVLEPQFARFLQVASDNLHLFDLMPIRRSTIREVVLLPDGRYPSYDPSYIYVGSVLLVGSLTQCEAEREQGFVAVNLHEYAHSIFAANVYRTFRIDAVSAYQGRYDPQAAFAEKGVRGGELDKLVPIGELVSPFAEVFADAFTALALADPKAVATALRDCGHANLRDFDEPYDASSWDGGGLSDLPPSCHTSLR
jgi:hypothetical protein